jgi:hypothetical protein
MHRPFKEEATFPFPNRAHVCNYLGPAELACRTDSARERAYQPQFSDAALSFRPRTRVTPR